MRDKKVFIVNVAMQYVVAIEDGEMVRVTEDGFESTGFFILPSSGAPITVETVKGFMMVSAYY